MLDASLARMVVDIGVLTGLVVLYIVYDRWVVGWPTVGKSSGHSASQRAVSTQVSKATLRPRVVGTVVPFSSRFLRTPAARSPMPDHTVPFARRGRA